MIGEGARTIPHVRLEGPGRDRAGVLPLVADPIPDVGELRMVVRKKEVWIGVHEEARDLEDHSILLVGGVFPGIRDRSRVKSHMVTWIIMTALGETLREWVDLG